MDWRNWICRPTIDPVYPTGTDMLSGWSVDAWKLFKDRMSEQVFSWMSSY